MIKPNDLLKHRDKIVIGDLSISRNRNYKPNNTFKIYRNGTLWMDIYKEVDLGPILWDNLNETMTIHRESINAITFLKRFKLGNRLVNLFYRRPYSTKSIDAYWIN